MPNTHDERAQRYAEAVGLRHIDDAPARLKRVMAVADAENARWKAQVQEELELLGRDHLAANERDALRAEVERLRERINFWIDGKAAWADESQRLERALADERAKVARVEALVAEWKASADALALTDVGTFDHTINIAARGAIYDCVDDLRAALAGPEPETTA